MLQAHTSVNQLYTEISESESASLESNLTVEISELKKSQEALATQSLGEARSRLSIGRT